MVSLWTKWLFPEIFHFKAEMNWELSAEQSVTSKTGPAKKTETELSRYDIKFSNQLTL